LNNPFDQDMMPQEMYDPQIQAMMDPYMMPGAYALPSDILEQIEDMEPEERQYILDELAVRPDLWGEEEVLSL